MSSTKESIDDKLSGAKKRREMRIQLDDANSLSDILNLYTNTDDQSFKEECLLKFSEEAKSAGINQIANIFLIHIGGQEIDPQIQHIVKDRYNTLKDLQVNSLKKKVLAKDFNKLNCTENIMNDGDVSSTEFMALTSRLIEKDTWSSFGTDFLQERNQAIKEQSEKTKKELGI